MPVFGEAKRQRIIASVRANGPIFGQIMRRACDLTDEIPKKAQQILIAALWMAC